MGALRDKVLQAAPGEVADVVILSDAALAALRTAKCLHATPACGNDPDELGWVKPRNVSSQKKRSVRPEPPHSAGHAMVCGLGYGQRDSVCAMSKVSCSNVAMHIEPI